MGTRSVIAWKTPTGWQGRYCHWDGYPTGVGKALRDNAWGYFKDHGGIERMKEVLFKEHYSWSAIVGADFSLSPGYVNADKRELLNNLKVRRPECHCHGDWNEKDNWIIQHNDAPGDREWAYVIDPKTLVVEVLRAEPNDPTDYKKGSHWAFCGKYTLNGPEPDWQLLECGPNLERCCHRPSYHDKTVCPRCDGKKYRDNGGHTMDPEYSFAFRDHTDCVPVEKLQEPVRSLYFADERKPKKNWHVFAPRLCEECGGTGKVQSKEAATT